MRIEFFFSKSTGKGAEAVEALNVAVEATAAVAEVVFTEVADSEDARNKHCLGSPTIRVNGVDVEYGERAPDEYTSGTRYYNTPEGWQPFPHARMIANTILEQAAREKA
jgi:hypothetical protein